MNLTPWRHIIVQRLFRVALALYSSLNLTKQFKK